MRYRVLASDYDGTLAHHGAVDPETLAAIERLAHSGRKLILVTGRELDSLREVFPRLDVCDWIVAENGALLYQPSTREERILAEPPPPEFVERLRELGVRALSVGRVIVATRDPYGALVRDAIRELGLELEIIDNKGAVMVLPRGVDKRSGLEAALEEMALSRCDAVGVGDAENDAALITSTGCGVAVANALPGLKGLADWITERSHGAGVSELIDRLIEDDLAFLDGRVARHRAAGGRETAR